MRAQKLERRLAWYQAANKECWGGDTLDVKHTLMRNREYKCSRVLFSTKCDYQWPIKSDIAQLPQFIISQVVNQNITDLDSSWSCLRPLVTFILYSLPKGGFPSQGSYPTIISWRSPSAARIYSIFAFLSVRMESKVYTLEELLALRGSNFCNHLLERARFDRDIGMRSLSSWQSGHFPMILNTRRGQLLTCHDQADLLRRTKTISLPRQQLQGGRPSSEPEEKPRLRGYRQLDGQDPEFKPQAKSDPKAVINQQPQVVPVPPQPQRSESFKQFFKQVSSPTHIRVTAGGRIVPNTRNAVSPTGKRNKDRPNGDDKSAIQSSEAAPHIHSTAPGMYSGGFAGPGVQPIPAYQYVPMPVGVNMYSAYQAPPVAGSQPRDNQQQADAGHTRKNQVDNKTTVEGDNDKSMVLWNTPPDPQVTAPVHMYGGQWVPQHAPCVPFGMMPPHPPVAPIPFVGAVQNSHPAQLSQLAGPYPYYSGFQQYASQHPQSAVPPALAPIPQWPQPLISAPSSSIRRSGITKNQLNMLRSTLKHHEDQLMYNKHQIDEKDMGHRIELLRRDIQQFEWRLKQDLAAEQALLQQLQEQDINKPSASSDSATAKTPATSGQSTNIKGTQNPQPLAEERKAEVAQPSRKDAKVKAISVKDPTSSINSEPSTSSDATGSTTIVNKQPRPSSGLPASAALAPPFTPGSDTLPKKVGVVAHKSAAVIRKSSSLTDENRKPAHKQQLAPLGDGWNLRPKLGASSTHKMIPSSSSEAGAIPGTDISKNGLGTPYLIGILPPGRDSRTMDDADYIYARELTEEELRARHLYWGKAPLQVQKGLPKFDGKDFYPPSPIADGACSSDVSDSQAVDGVGADYPIKFGSSEVDPFGYTSSPSLPKANQFGNVRRTQSDNVNSASAYSGGVKGVLKLETNRKVRLSILSFFLFWDRSLGCQSDYCFANDHYRLPPNHFNNNHANLVSLLHHRPTRVMSLHFQSGQADVECRDLGSSSQMTHCPIRHDCN
jgi:hypothetical protein